jgi:hypothetical protein
MAGGEWTVGVGSSKPAEHQDVVDVDEGERGHTRNDVAHQKGQLLGVVDHESAAALSTTPYALTRLIDNRAGRVTLADNCATEKQFGEAL